MKILLLTRGAPGAGKTTYLRAHGLHRYVVSPDQIRCEIGGVYETDKGVQERGYFNEQDVWKRVYGDIRERMQLKEPVVVDATFQNLRDFKTPFSLAKLHNYEVHIIDFTSVPEMVAQERNAQRSGWQHVPPNVISNAYIKFHSERLPKSASSTPFTDFEGSCIYQALVKRLPS